MHRDRLFFVEAPGSSVAFFIQASVRAAAGCLSFGQSKRIRQIAIRSWPIVHQQQVFT
jgi:hypothetical protein